MSVGGQRKQKNNSHRSTADIGAGVAHEALQGGGHAQLGELRTPLGRLPRPRPVTAAKPRWVSGACTLQVHARLQTDASWLIRRPTRLLQYGMRPRRRCLS